MYKYTEFSVAEVLGLNKLVGKVSKVIEKFLCWIREKVELFFDWLLGRCGACRQKQAMAMGKKPCGTCFVAETRVGSRWITEVAIGRLVETYELWEREGKPQSTRLPRDPALLRMVVLKLEKAGGGRVAIKMLRRVEWLMENGVAAGGLLWLEQREMGAVGWAQVTAVQACPPLEEGDGELVISTYAHESGEVLDLYVEGETKPTGVTPSHPFWSVDRNDWVPVGELRVGERLQGTGGATPRVLRLEKRAKATEVFNIEVDGDHVYRVGQQGLLVHNASIQTIERTTATDPDYANFTYLARKRKLQYKCNFKKSPDSTTGEPISTGLRVCTGNLGYLAFRKVGKGDTVSYLGAVQTANKAKETPNVADKLGKLSSPIFGYDDPVTHTEQRAIKLLLEYNPEAATELEIIAIFTERKPCFACDPWLMIELKKFNVDSGGTPCGVQDIPVYWLVPSGADVSDRALWVKYKDLWGPLN